MIDKKEVVEHTYSGRVAGVVTAPSDDGTVVQGVTKKNYETRSDPKKIHFVLQ